jgi:hypothetical protein
LYKVQKRNKNLLSFNSTADSEYTLHDKLGLGLKVWEERMQKKTF